MIPSIQVIGLHEEITSVPEVEFVIVKLRVTIESQPAALSRVTVGRLVLEV